MGQDTLRYPIGRFRHEGPISDALLAEWIADLERLPDDFRAAVDDLSDAQLDMPYRPGGWTIRQVVHHVPDSHVNAYVRFKLALTEQVPTIRPYDEKGWATLPDCPSISMALNLTFLSVLHQKWVHLLRSVDREALNRRFVHPISGEQELAWTVGSYAWHGRHHLAHITHALRRSVV